MKSLIAGKGKGIFFLAFLVYLFVYIWILLHDFIGIG